MAKLRIVHLRFLVPFVVLAWRVSLPIGDNSFLWHVRAGTIQLDLGHVLTTDPFSFTCKGAAWRTQSWLAELGYGWMERTFGGIAWVPLMKFVVVGLTIALIGMVIFRVTGRRSGITLTAMLLVLWQALPFAIARPALLGFLLLACVVAVAHMRRRALWLLPLLFWLWASVHGLFVVGLGYLFLDGMRRQSRRQVIAVAVSGLATLFTAHGFGVWLILVQFLRNRAALDLISEWQPPDFSNPFVVPLLLIILSLLAVGTIGRLEPSDLWIIVPFVSFGVLVGRNVYPAAMVLLPLAMRALPPRNSLEKARASEAPALNWVFALVLVAAAVAGLTRDVSLREDRFPAADAVAALGSSRVYNGTAVGGYLIYAEWPEREVYVDDRAELFGEAGLAEFHDLKAGLGVEERFAALGIDQAIVKPDWPIVEYLVLIGWEFDYEDEFFVVMSAGQS
ncbi:MAG: hypothetical protein GY722_21825 [bacterium]|nr:hypothetical protein [bacterium]